MNDDVKLMIRILNKVRCYYHNPYDCNNCDSRIVYPEKKL